MKKIICILLSTLIVSSVLVGCQKTPDSIVVGKDQNEMIEKAQASGTGNSTRTSDSTLREKTQAPETLKNTLTKNNMTIAVNANVDVPNSNGINIIRVKAGDFSQEQITSLWKELIGDAQMFQTSNEMTKAEIQAAIVFAKGKIGPAKSDDDKEFYQKQIDYFNSIYNSAPEQHVQKPADDQLQNLYISTYGSGQKEPFTGIEAKSKDGTVSFQVQNSYRNSYGDTALATFAFHKGPGNTPEQEGEPKVDTYDVNLTDKNAPETAQGLKLSPADAKVKVESFLSAANIPFVVRAASLKKSSDRSNSYYTFSCVRAIGNIPCAQILGETYQKNEDTGYTATWQYEDLFITIDDSGITDVLWDYPIETTETVVNNCTLMSFPDIQAIFNKMMFVTYECQAKGTKELACDITGIKLEMMRINEQNEQKAGLLTPVWNFYGVRTTKNEDGTSTKTSNIILMSINAVDGSIIDTVKGY